MIRVCLQINRLFVNRPLIDFLHQQVIPVDGPHGGPSLNYDVRDLNEAVETCGSNLLYLSQVQKKFRGVFSFFTRMERGEILVEIPELVLFEVFYVLAKLYHVPLKEAAERLGSLISFKGIVMRDKPVAKTCLRILQYKAIGLVDAYLLASARQKGVDSVYSFDQDLSKQGLRLLEVN